MFKRKRQGDSQTQSPAKIPIIPDDRDKLPVAGPLLGRTSMSGMRFDLWNDESILPEQMEGHVPDQRLYPIEDETGKVLTARSVTSMRKRNLMPHLYANPVQHLDYRIYESLLKHTFIGSLMDTFVKYLMGRGFKPVLEIINPDEDDNKNKELIDKNQMIITDLLQIDTQLDKNSDGHLDMTFHQKVASMMTSMLAYNRGALIFDYEAPVEINGKVYTDIPSHMMFAHAQDLGIIETDPVTRRLKGVQWRHSFDTFIEVKDMIYLWNPQTSSKVHNSQFYGISVITPMISASKMLRQLLSDDFPAMARKGWAGMYLLVVKNDGNTTQSKQEEYEAVARGIGPGKGGILIKDPEDVAVHPLNFDPKVAEFQSLFESMIKLCISIIGLPQVGFYDESAANRSTMMGKIQLTMRTVIEPMRKWISESFSPQHYQRWFELLYKDQPELIKTFKISLEWTDLHIAEWYDSIEAAMELDGRHQLKNNAFGNLAGIDNYETMLDPDGETMAGGAGNNKMSMTDGESGNKFEMKSTKGPKDNIGKD